MKSYGRTELTAWARQAECLWLFLDYDGTLAEFAPTPHDILPNPEIIQIVEQLAARPEIRITVLSGRSLKHVQQLVPVQRIFLAGSYGLEIRTPEGEIVHRLNFQTLRPLLEAIKPQWTERIAGRHGFFLEDKGWTLAIHARFADDSEAEQVLHQASQIDEIVALSPDLRIVGGHKFLEVAPRQASKREAVRFLLETYPFERSRLVYIGDDDKDEDAFPIIHDHGGVTVKVLQPSQLSQPTEADVSFSNPRETLDWLRVLL